MTVAQLIEKLQAVEDKNLDVRYLDGNEGGLSIREVEPVTNYNDDEYVLVLN